MMTGQIIGGAPITDAVKYQQIIIFMISAAVALGVLSAIFVSALFLLRILIYNTTSLNYEWFLL